MLKPVRTALVGLGKHARQLALASQKTERLQIVSFCGRDAAEAEAFVRDVGYASVSSFDGILRDPDIEAAILVTPNDLHCSQTIALAEAGKHVFVEKPISNTLAEAEAMIDACRRAGVLLAVGHQERRHGPYRYMRECLRRGDLGRVIAFEANHCGNLLAVWPEDDWRFQCEKNAGPILHKGSHKIDILNYLFGEAEAVATLSMPLRFNPAMPETTVSTIRYRSGIIGSLSTGFAHTNASLNLFGERRSLFYSGFGSRLSIKNEKTWECEAIDCGSGDPLVEELDEFAAAVRGEATVEVDGEAGRRALLLAIALQDAATRERVVLIESFESAAVRSPSRSVMGAQPAGI